MSSEKHVRMDAVAREYVQRDKIHNVWYEREKNKLCHVHQYSLIKILLVDTCYIESSVSVCDMAVHLPLWTNIYVCKIVNYKIINTHFIIVKSQFLLFISKGDYSRLVTSELWTCLYGKHRSSSVSLVVTTVTFDLIFIPKWHLSRVHYFQNCLCDICITVLDQTPLYLHFCIPK